MIPPIYDKMSSFNKDRHVKYWLRCVRTFLPNAYTSTDSSRMSLAFFIVAALDLLGMFESIITKEERLSWIEWIYSCQTPEGGFRGFTGTDLMKARNQGNRHWDPANVPATFFAICSLIILGDDLSALRRDECLSWLAKLQRENGSVGETLAEDDGIEGGSDPRFCSCAAGIVYLLRPGNTSNSYQKMVLQCAKLAQYVKSCQVGLSDFPRVNLTGLARRTKVVFRKSLFVRRTVS